MVDCDDLADVEDLELRNVMRARSKAVARR